MRTNGPYTIGILADDLTSAADGAAPFVQRGLRALVGRRRLPLQQATILAVDSGSRSLLASQAAQRAAELAEQLASRDVLYKTVDSTLRGHVRAEIEAAFTASGRKMLVFAPAFPGAGRTTVGGVQLVDGIPVAETGYRRDPVHPARHSRLVELVPSSIGNVVILDATTQGELDAGSPGMALALAERLASVQVGSDVTLVRGRDILVIVGSANPRSHRQADRIGVEQGVALLRAPVERIDDPNSILRDIAQAAARRLVTSVSTW
jgi:uncharacterized protein YgbK (DUF1537 family)